MTSDNVQTGIITRIALKNFVTYDEVTIKPGRNLNLIIGANGTGKSTIVSAIVLGLGGNTKVIGRATHVADFIKADAKQAVIEIDLQSGANKFVTITRTFDDQNHTSWMVNNKSTTYKQIIELMKTFNIQVDNLCQFLPQDKVQEFSNLSHHDLLLETERSVGDVKLLKNHIELKELRVKQVQLEKDLEMKTQLQTKEKQTYDSLKDSVGHIKEQTKIKNRLKTLKQKKAWILYQNKREEFMKAKKGRDKAEAIKNSIQKKLKPVEDEISKIKVSIQGLEKTIKEHNNETSAKTIKLNKLLHEIETYEKAVDDIVEQCEEEIKREQECDERLNEMRQEKDKLENDLKHLINNTGTVENLQAQFDSTTSIMTQHKNNLNDLKSQQNFKRERVDHLNRRINAEEQNLQAVQDIENKRLELLQKLSRDAYEGVKWLRSNKHLFSNPVHEPMLLHINLKNAEFSKYFENIINQRDLTAFVCENKNDMNLLVKYLRDQQKLKINVVHSDPDKYINDQPSIPLNDIRQYGFEHYLISLIDAPKTILNYIISMYRINEIPIGNDNVTSNLENIPLQRFFSTNNSYSVSRSKYTGEKSTRQAAISSRGVLSITVDTQRMSYIQNEIFKLTQERNAIMCELETFKEKFDHVNSKIDALKKTRNTLHENKCKIENLKMRINVNNNSIKELQKQRCSIDEIRSKHKSQIQGKIMEQLRIYRQHNKLLDDCYKNIINDKEMKLQIKLQKNKLALKENDSQDLREEFDNAERRYKLLVDELGSLKAEVKNLYDLAKDSTGGLSYDDPDFAPIKNAFSKLPGSIEEIFEEIQSTQAKIFFTNDQEESNRKLKEFENTKKRLENLNEIIKEKELEFTNITEKIRKLKDEWLPMLETLVEKINKNFSNYFTKMKCAGEVSLSTTENKMDFDKYGLTIRVKFRDADELQVLTRNHQSGGERAVTTAVYMISLQELSKVPFRCVDEINQGMDAANERRVFELIVNITSKSNSSQYFLLTPKLLPDLKYTDSVTVLTVFNGKYMLPCSQFDIHENCARIIDAVLKRKRAVL